MRLALCTTVNCMWRSGIRENIFSNRHGCSGEW